MAGCASLALRAGDPDAALLDALFVDANLVAAGAGFRLAFGGIAHAVRAGFARATGDTGTA